jgi:hypothetical protein
MSPKKTSSAKTSKAKQLTIDFSGICTLLLDRKAAVATVHLVDLASAGFQRHFAALGLVVSDDMGRGIKGPDADAAVSLPGDDRDVGLWDLLGTEIELVGATGKLTVDDSRIDPTKKPGAKSESLEWLPNIGFLAQSTKVDAVCPTAATIEITAGHITALAAGSPRKVEFVDGGTLVAPPRYYLPRFRARIPFEQELALRLDRQRVLRFTDSSSVMISNTCVCGLGQASPANHFYAHYDVVQAKRRPKVQPSGAQPMTPLQPEWCFVGFVRRL